MEKTLFIFDIFTCYKFIFSRQIAIFLEPFFRLLVNEKFHSEKIMSNHYVIIAEDQTYDEFLSEQESRHNRFCIESRIAFHQMVDSYFRADHHLSDDQMLERRIEVN